MKRLMKEERWVAEYKRAGALWLHSGNPQQPHVLLSAGGHSAGYFNSEKIMESPDLLDEAAFNLMLRFAKQAGFTEVDRVVAPAMGGITLAHDLARNYRSMFGRKCLRSYTQKVGLSKLSCWFFLIFV